MENNRINTLKQEIEKGQKLKRATFISAICVSAVTFIGFFIFLVLLCLDTLTNNPNIETITVISDAMVIYTALCCLMALLHLVGAGLFVITFVVYGRRIKIAQDDLDFRTEYMDNHDNVYDYDHIDKEDDIEK